MKREEFFTSTVLQKIKEVYNIFNVMQDKYKNSESYDQPYSFIFYNYNNLDLDVVMNMAGFFVYESSRSREEDSAGDEPIFKLTRRSYEHPWFENSVIMNDLFSFKGDEPINIHLGDHPDPAKCNVKIHSWDDVETLSETLSEEWFFQQYTTQNIITYEEFCKEVEFCLGIYGLHIPKSDFIVFEDFENFDINVLEGFRVI